MSRSALFAVLVVTLLALPAWSYDENDKPANDAAADAAKDKAAVAEFVRALTRGRDYQALDILAAGMDPNGRDAAGMPVLNWAILACQPTVVQALVNKKADLKYERAPGLTVLKEAAACKSAQKILRAAGAR